MEIVAGTAATPAEPITQDWGTTCGEGRMKEGNYENLYLQEEAASHDEVYSHDEADPLDKAN